MNLIAYRAGYKYQLAEDYTVSVGIHPPEDIDTEFIKLDKDGSLLIKRGYAWDGPSGPTIDTRNFMRGSLVHDALYQLIRWGYLPPEAREQADKELHQICLEDGMTKIRAWWVYRAVRRCAGSAASADNRKKVIIAP